GKKGFCKEKNPNWQGGITEANWDLRRTTEYLEWRRSVLKRDNWTCQICFYKGNELNVDHIKPFSKYKKLRLSIDNGRVLC
ncbi:HNH endonuclease, partial [Streptococcus sp. 210928-DFI.4.42]|uniref:HNH endonuclease n=1 Tax=Streptococcus sp. 210928-DFI.4.42 TaxID=2883234 RepID=UPI001D070203